MTECLIYQPNPDSSNVRTQKLSAAQQRSALQPAQPSLFPPFILDPGNASLTSIATALSLLADGALVTLPSLRIVRVVALLVLLFDNVFDQQVRHVEASTNVAGNHAVAKAREEPLLKLGLCDRLAALAQLLDHGESLLAIVRDADRPHRCRRLQRQPELERALGRGVEAAASNVPQWRRQRCRASFDQAQDHRLVLTGVGSRIPDPKIDLDGAQDARKPQNPAALEPASEGRGAVSVDAVCAVPGLDVEEA